MASQIDPTLDGKLLEIGTNVPKPELRLALETARDEITDLQENGGGGGDGGGGADPNAVTAAAPNTAVDFLLATAAADGRSVKQSELPGTISTLRAALGSVTVPDLRGWGSGPRPAVHSAGGVVTFDWNVGFNDGAPVDGLRGEGDATPSPLRGILPVIPSVGRAGSVYFYELATLQAPPAPFEVADCSYVNDGGVAVITLPAGTVAALNLLVNDPFTGADFTNATIAAIVGDEVTANVAAAQAATATITFTVPAYKLDGVRRLTLPEPKTSGSQYFFIARTLPTSSTLGEIQLAGTDAIELPLTTPADIAASGTPTAGSLLAYVSEGAFEWIGSIVAGTSHATVTVGTGVTLTAALHGRGGVSGSSLVTRLVVARNGSDQSAAVTLTLEENCAQPVRVRVANDQTGAVTINRAGTNTFNGAATSIVLGGAGSTVDIEPSRLAGDFAVEGEYVAGRALLGGLSVPVLTASGTLSMAVHSGHVVLLNGNATVPVVNGFSATLVASGANRDVNAGGAALTITNGTAITVWSNGSTVWHTPAVTLATLATV